MNFETKKKLIFLALGLPILVLSGFLLNEERSVTQSYGDAQGIATTLTLSSQDVLAAGLVVKNMQRNVQGERIKDTISQSVSSFDLDGRTDSWDDLVSAIYVFADDPTAQNYYDEYIKSIKGLTIQQRTMRAGSPSTFLESDEDPKRMTLVFRKLGTVVVLNANFAEPGDKQRLLNFGKAIAGKITS